MHEQLLHANAIASNNKGKYIAHKISMSLNIVFLFK